MNQLAIDIPSNSSNTLTLHFFKLTEKIKILTRNRSKRGLINVIGKAHKWLFGTMDNDDRELIDQNLEIIKKNDHNLIETVNKQISINRDLSDNILKLKKTLDDDRRKFADLSKGLNNVEKQLINKLEEIEVRLRTKLIEDQIDIILDQISMMKLGLVHPGLLTYEKLQSENLDIDRLQNLKTGIIRVEDEMLVLAIKIPKTFDLVDLKIDIPIPNMQHLELDSENIRYVT